MKRIIVKKENAERIMSEFAKAQGKATERIIKNYEQLADIIDDINYRLHGISKTALEGTQVEYHFARRFSKSYKYIPQSTHFILFYSKGNWHITDIARVACPNRFNRGYPYNLYLTDEARQAVLNLYK